MQIVRTHTRSALTLKQAPQPQAPGVARCPWLWMSKNHLFTITEVYTNIKLVNQ